MSKHFNNNRLNNLGDAVIKLTEISASQTNDIFNMAYDLEIIKNVVKKQDRIIKTNNKRTFILGILVGILACAVKKNHNEIEALKVKRNKEANDI